MQSRVYVTSGVRLSVCLSCHLTAAVVCFLLRTVLAGGIKQQQRPPDARHLAANASSVTLSAVVGSSTQSYFFCICTENTHTHTNTCLTALFPGLPRWAGTRKVKQICILLKQDTMSGSGISWAICTSAPCSRQITMPAPHHSSFYTPDALPAAQPAASKHWRDILII